MAVNLKDPPYYDDFDENKNFQKILFKPGVSLQSRELNQIQSILQTGIQRTADGIYGDSARISNEPSSFTILDDEHNQIIRSVKITGVGANVASYVGKYITGATSNTIGLVRFAFEKDDPVLNDPATLVISVESSKELLEFSSAESIRVYNNFNDAYQKNNNIAATEVAAGSITIFATATASAYDDEITFITLSGDLAVGDELVLPRPYRQGLFVTKIISNLSVRLNFPIGFDLTDGVTMRFERKNTCPTSIVNVSSGTYYKKGTYTKIGSQSVVPDKYTNLPSKSIILKYNEEVVNYLDDNSLLDPAFESSNYLAPGADRLKSSLTIQSVDLNSNNLPDTTDDYVEVVRFVEGRIDLVENAKNTLPLYLNNILAERTYDESGNYEVKPFRLSPRGSSSDDTYAKFLISPGKAVVGGQFIETVGATALNVPKSKTSQAVEDIFINANQDQYIVIDAPQFGLIDPNAIRFYDVLEVHNTIDRNAMSASSLIGYVVVKHIVYDSGEGASVKYRMYFTWSYQASTSLTWLNSKSLISKNNIFSSYASNDGTYSSPKFFATVNSTKGIDASGQLIPYEIGDRTKLLFPIDNKFIKSISNIRIYHNKRIQNQTVTNNVAAVSLSGTEQFIGNAGVLSSDTKRRYYQLIVKTTSFGSLSTGAAINLDSISMSLNADKNSLSIDLNTLLVEGSIDLLVTIYNSELSRKTKHLNVNVPSEPISIMTSEFPYNIYKSDIHALKGIYSIGSNVFLRNYNSATTYSLNDHVTYNGVMYRALSSSTGQPVSNKTYWEQIAKEPSSFYSFDNGATETHYEHATVSYKGKLTEYNPGNVVVVVDYFTHSGTGVIDFNSYPVNIQNTIPNFRASDGTVYNLRQTLDFRPKKNDTNVAANFWADNNSNTYVLPHPTLENALQIDYEFYKPRIDRLYLFNRNTSTTTQGYNFYLDSGIADLNPKVPKNQSSKDRFLIATLIVPPFTQNSSDIKIVYNKAPRYTMSDIQTIDQRLTTLEKRVKKQGLDIVALNNQIFEGGNTEILLFKTGVLVDDFSTIVSNDIKSPYSTCTVDTFGRQLLPSMSSVMLNLVFASQPDLNVASDIVTFKVLEEEALITSTEPSYTIEQSGGSSTSNVSLINPNSGGVKSVGTGFISMADVSVLAGAGALAIGKDSVVVAQGFTDLFGVGPSLNGAALSGAGTDILAINGSVFNEPLTGGVSLEVFGGAALTEAALAGLALSSTVGASIASGATTATTGLLADIAAGEAAASVLGSAAVAEAGFVAGLLEFGAAVAASTCFTEDTFISMADGSTKKIKDIVVGDLVFNKDKTQVNKVLYVEKDKDINFGGLYSPSKKYKPFATMNHPLYIEGVLSCPNPEDNYKWYPWLGKNNKLEPALTSDPKDIEVYNLWVDGDNTFVVNEFGTHSIIENVDMLVKNYHEGKITYEQVKFIQSAFSDEENKIYGGILILKLCKKLGLKFVIDMLCTIHKDNSKPMLQKLTFGVTKMIGKIGWLFK